MKLTIFEKILFFSKHTNSLNCLMIKTLEIIRYFEIIRCFLFD